MKKIITIVCITATLILTVITAVNVSAGRNSALLQAHTRVLPIAKHTLLHQERNLTVTEADINRGYVDVQKAMVLSIKTNSPNGYLLLFAVGSGLFNEFFVFDGNNTHPLSAEGGEVHMPYQGIHYITKELSFRFHLLPDTQTGTYQWPVAVMVNAL